MAGLGTWALSDALEVEKQPKLSTVAATVKRVDDDGTAWVTLGEGAGEFPATGNTAEINPGDTVSVRIQNGTATIGGNVSDPSAGVTRVVVVENLARDTAEESARTAQAVVDAQQTADEAQKVAEATNQHFFADDNGAHVTDVTQDEWAEAVDDDFSDYDPDTKPYHNQLLNSLGILLRTALNNLVSITRSAIAFYDGTGNNAANIVARFGSDGAQIGKSGAAHSVIDANGQRFYATNGITQLANIGYGEGTNVSGGVSVAPYFLLGQKPTAAVYSTTKNYTFSDICRYNDKYYCCIGDTSGAWDSSKWVEFSKAGTRGNLSLTEGYSSSPGYTAHSEGNRAIADGFASHAEGRGTLALGDQSHSEGSYTAAFGVFSHAEGADTVAKGLASHAQNRGTIAASTHQTAIGSYNVEDTADQYALIIGNGTGDANRSNAFAVDWDGGILTAKPLFKRVSATSAAQTINAGAGANFTITVNVPDGYTLFGVIGQTSNHNLAGTIGSARVTGVSTVATSLTNRTASTNWTDATVTVDTICVLSTVV